MMGLLSDGNMVLSMDVDLVTSIQDRLIGTVNLKSNRMEANPKNPISFTCQSSTDCCSKLKVPITDFDIKRIEDHEYQLGQIVDEVSPILVLPETNEGNIEKYYWIKRKPFTNTCTFLLDGLCSIHEFKPYGCQIFPFSLRQISEDEIQVLVHPSGMCSNVLQSDNLEENESILLEVLELIIIERDFRKNYFEKYGRKI